MNTHAENAESLIARSHTNSDKALAYAMSAVAEATLALAEEQRTANLQTYMTDTVAARRDTKGVSEAGLKVIDDWISEKMSMIRERLGMEK
ncbi:hypothetical protein SEA_MARCIE_55 [Microbacterium phage Marcie]|nr:hypothetical protein SEA_MARCIE_55 [Microbacterium phage Marcie]